MKKINYKDWNGNNQPSPFDVDKIRAIWKYADLTTSKLIGFGQKKWGENLIYAVPVNN